MGRPANTVEKLMATKVHKTEGCWIWTGSRVHGYGQTSINGHNARAHKLIYEYLVGPVPEGLQLDHLCRNPLCVNPAHLEPVTARENTLRSTAITAQNAKKTHCKRGHELTEANVIRNARGRECAICRREIHYARSNLRRRNAYTPATQR